MRLSAWNGSRIGLGLNRPIVGRGGILAVPSANENGRQSPIGDLLFQVFLDVERQLDHAFEQLIGRHTREILQDQFLGI